MVPGRYRDHGPAGNRTQSRTYDRPPGDQSSRKQKEPTMKNQTIKTEETKKTTPVKP